MPERRAGFRGYCTHQPFGGFRIPVPVQNLMLRDYASRNRLAFLLSVNELNFTDCYLGLETVLGELDRIEGVIMASLSMLPSDRGVRANVFERLLAAGGALHSVLENVVIAGHGDVARAEENLLLAAALTESPKSVADEIIPEFPGFRSFTN